MARRCTYRDPDTHRRCPHPATHASILEVRGGIVWTPYDCTWAPSAHSADFCLGHSEDVSAQRTRQAEEALYV